METLSSQRSREVADFVTVASVAGMIETVDWFGAVVLAAQLRHDVDRKSSRIPNALAAPAPENSAV